MSKLNIALIGAGRRGGGAHQTKMVVGTLRVPLTDYFAVKYNKLCCQYTYIYDILLMQGISRFLFKEE